ncbi:hypothetical protein RSOL_103950 [Rhizoctonia solani AG-3 Rhs1AP]|uniref:Transmembrane protein n=2 Tax=Rhizoctonia solani AG-3 TaxID=1086053 RepID=A0A074RDE2_9AGAM|nr:hypothetical protein RSOL_103950 [Rhizoctonia solani AG-3 Rhs1AP]KEP45191.1 hypothetical protein V565_305310 [Rhizoctonia solani 123E]
MGLKKFIVVEQLCLLIHLGSTYACSAQWPGGWRKRRQARVELVYFRAQGRAACGFVCVRVKSGQGCVGVYSEWGSFWKSGDPGGLSGCMQLVGYLLCIVARACSGESEFVSLIWL